MQVPAFGELLKRFRVAASLSQEALAERARMSAHAISSLERGARRAPYRDTVALLQDALALGSAERALLETAAEQGRHRRPRAMVPAEDTPQDNLPAQLTSFVGRNRDVAEIAALCAASRLVTVTGPGGIGKTRVALEACTRMQGAFRDGIWFVDLAPITDGASVSTRVAAAAGVRVGDGDATQSLALALRKRALLLVVDNCEHVLAGVEATVSVLLQTCPHVAVLATSRERLGIPGESVYRLSPLGVPPAHAPLEHGARAYSAVELFVERAGLGAQVAGSEQFAIVASICRRLDGIPLALELAAARVPTLGLSGLRDRLDEHFKVLARGGRSAPARQQTMRAAIAWSHDLLSPSERVLFRHLAIFAGGWRLDAAEAVCGGNGLAARDVVDVLASLVEKSLVVTENDGHLVRFGFLELTRAFAREQLIASGERPALAEAHAQWMGAFADWAYEEYHHIPPRRWSEFVAPELDNAYVALEWANGEGDDIRLAGRILAGLRSAFTDSAGSLREFRDWVVDALARVGAGDDPILHAHLLRALMAVCRSDELIAAAERAVSLFTEIGEVRGLGRSLELQASGYLESGAFEKAADAVDRALRLYRDHGLGRSSAYAIALDTRADVLQNQQRFDEAERDQAEALSIAEVQDDDWFVLHLRISRAAVALTANEPRRAATLAEEAVAESRSLRAPRYEMYALVNLAGARIALDDLTGAHDAALAALRLGRYRDVLGAVASMLYIATVAGLEGRSRAAARLLGYVDAWALSGFQWGASEAATRKRLMTALEVQLSPETLAADMEIGARLDEETATEEALRA